MPNSNIEKNIRGNSLKAVLEYMLALCKQLGYISDYKKDYKLGMPGYSDKNQFKASYLLQFDDGSNWIVYTTTSLRDRVKEQYWDALNLKGLNPKITKAFLVYPDGISTKEKHTFEAKNNKILSHGEYSPLDELLSQDAFFNRIEKYASRLLSSGQYLDRKGKNFEKRVTSIINNPSNIKKWAENNSLIEGLHYEMFYTILHTLKINPVEIDDLQATCDIKPLPSGGPPKTDILITTYHQSQVVHQYAISCKNSTSKAVSVHQYSADQFADVLDHNNEELRELLKLFQTCGNRKDMGEENALRLESLLAPHLKELCKWALAGIGGEGDPATQWVDYILTYNSNNETISIHSIEDYCTLLLSDTPRSFGTPFSWTYQGNRGTNIQLKVPII